MQQRRVQSQFSHVKAARGTAGTFFLCGRRPPINPEDATEFADIRDAYDALRSEKANAKAAGEAKKATAKTAGKTPGPTEYLKQMKAAIADLKVNHNGKDSQWYIQEAQKSTVTEVSQGHNQITRRANMHNRKKGNQT